VRVRVVGLLLLFLPFVVVVVVVGVDVGRWTQVSQTNANKQCWMPKVLVVFVGVTADRGARSVYLLCILNREEEWNGRCVWLVV
jgi:hypothetical protein